MGLNFRFAVFFVFLTSILSAQLVLHSKSDTTSPKKQGIKISVLNPHGKEPIEYTGHSMHSDSVPYAVKLNPFNFSRGEFVLYYEHRLSDAFSVEAAGGVTYIDYLYEIGNNGGAFWPSTPQQKLPTKFYTGTSAKIQFRYYPSKYETAITGYYFAPELSYKNYKMDYMFWTGLAAIPNRVERKWTDIKLQFGYQNADPYDKIFFDWYVSAGFRKFNETVVNGTGYDMTFTNEKYWGPVFGAGVKVGFTL